MLGGSKRSSVHFIHTTCQIVLISLLAGSPCGRKAPSLIDNERSGENPFKEDILTAREGATESGTGPWGWVQVSLCGSRFPT